MRLRVALLRKSRKFFLGLVLHLSVGLAVTIFLSGCGKKAPPIPPHKESSRADTVPRLVAEGGLLLERPAQNEVQSLLTTAAA